MWTEPTHDDGNTLDLFITNNDTLISDIRVGPGISDHSHLLIDSMIHPGKVQQKPRSIPLWKKTEKYVPQFTTFIEQEWASVDEDTKSDANKLWKWFTRIMDEGIKKLVPHRKAGKQDRHPWISRELKRLMRRESRAYARKKKRPTRPNMLRLKALKADVQRQYRKEYWAYVRDIMLPSSDGENDPGDSKKKLYNYIKHCKKDSIGVAPILNTETGKIETDPKIKAELLNKQFHSVFSQVVPLSLSRLCKKLLTGFTRAPPMPEFDFSENGILKLLGTLKPHKAAGPDKLRPFLLRELREPIAPILEKLFSISYDTGTVPDDWKRANVAPIFKKGSRRKAENYRPVSLTCICSKMMEHIFVSQISRHLKEHKILIPSQHGFRQNLSCDTQLIQFIDDLHAGVNKAKQVDCIVMDFAKAFDKVSHDRLLYKLEGYGIGGKTLSWISDFLHGRSQQVVVDGESSASCPVTSGVPQGSVLGPILFLLYINDIGDNISSQIRLFADDTILYRVINSTTDAAALQADIVQLEKWCQEWQMVFHPAKCNLLRVSTSHSPIHVSYTLCDHVLEQVPQVKYLGVTITSKLKWDTHVANTRYSADATLRFLKRNLRIHSPVVKEAAYITYVRPKAEYASSTWDPHTKKVIKTIEMVQRSAARWTLGKDGKKDQKSSVTEMLNSLGWRSLELRRTDTRLTMLHKILDPEFDTITHPDLRPVTGIALSAYPHRLINFRKHTASQFNSFYPRTVRQWNALDSDVALTTLEVFKDRVSKVQHRAQ